MTLSRSELRRGCGKRRYRDELAAKVALAKIEARDDADHEERRPFRCSRCGGWHLTSQQPDPGRVKAGRSRDPDRQRKSLASPDANQGINPGPPRSDLRVNDFARPGQLRRVSKKRAAENRERRAMRDRCWPGGEIPKCVVPWCPLPADDLHEPLTRARGGSITDEANTVPMCRGHNDDLANRPTSELGWAYDLGLLVHSWDGAA